MQNELPPSTESADQRLLNKSKKKWIQFITLGAGIFSAAILGYSFVFSSDSVSAQSSLQKYVSVKKCAKCHRDLYNEWKLSRHARAWDSPFFKQKAKQMGNNCLVGCHAPQQVVNQDHMVIVSEPRLEGRDEGVSCFSCHASPHDQMLTMHGPIKDAKSDFHEVKYDPKFNSSNSCIPCHQYLEVYDQFMSLKNSGAKDKRCQDCHMPVQKRAVAVDGPLRDSAIHRFRGAYDNDLVKRSIRAALTRKGDQLVLEVENIGGGHQIPGGIWRTLVLKVVQNDSKNVVKNEKIYEFDISKKNTLLYKKPQVFQEKLKIDNGSATVMLMLRMLPNDTEPYYKKIFRETIAIK